MIKTEHLTYNYSPGTAAIEDITLEIRPGECLAVIGHTGSGKSTLVQHLNALLKPTAGAVFADGKNIWENKKSVRAARFLVGLCFQYPEYQLFDETIEKDIAFGPKNMGLKKEEIETRVKKAMAYVGLDEAYREKSPFDLSGGEKRRAAIAGVIAMEPRVLVMDEPTAGLDPQGRRQVLAMLAHYRAETGCTVVLISHNMDEVAETADRVLVMNKGRAAMLGTVREVFSRGEELQSMGLAVPTATNIAALLQKKGLAPAQDIFTAGDMLAWLGGVL